LGSVLIGAAFATIGAIAPAMMRKASERVIRNMGIDLIGGI